MAKIIDCLRSLNHFKSQNELISALGITKLELLEIIGKINHIEPDLINNHSSSILKLTRNLDWLNNNLICHYLSQLQQKDYTIKIVDELASTNTEIMENLHQYTDKIVVATELQSAGKGRFDRRWTSRIATDITASVLYILDKDLEFELLPLVAAIAINRLFKDFGLLTQIKWPNDIYTVNKTKIAGVLVESRIRNNSRYVVVGIGLDNVLMADRNKLLAYLINHLDQVIREYTKMGFPNLRREWLDNCIHHKKSVTVYSGVNLIAKGINSDLTLDGELVIQTESLVKKLRNFNISLKWDD